MVTENLWGEISNSERNVPVLLLRYQASVISELTNNIIEGRVETKGTLLGVTADLDLVAPLMNRYFITIVRMLQRLGTEYPITVTNVISRKEEIADNFEHFKSVLSTILQSVEVQETINHLQAYSQAQGTPPKGTIEIEGRDE